MSMIHDMVSQFFVNRSVLQSHRWNTPEPLQAALRSMLTEDDFQIGDIVTWKEEFLKNKGRPNLDEHAIVVDTYDNFRKKFHVGEVFDPEPNPGSPYFREPLTLNIGIFGPGNEFACFWVDGRRFKVVSRRGDAGSPSE